MIKRHIKSTNMDMTEAISAYLEKRIVSLEKFVHKAEDAIARIEVGKTSNHHHKGDIFRAEINLEYGEHRFRAVAESDDLYKAIDIMRDEIVGEVTRTTKKTRHLLMRGKQKIKQMVRAISRK